MDAIAQIKESIHENWEKFLEHIPSILVGLVVLILAILISGWLARVAQTRITKRADDPLLGRFLTKIVRTILVILGIMLAFNIMGLTGIAAGLLAGAGVGAIVIGFAFQDIGANFMSGLILAFNRPFSVGDTIEIDGNMGKVLALNLRVTHIKTFDGKDIFIPNSTLISEELINYTRDGFLRQSFIVGIDYGDDVDAARSHILEGIKRVPEVLQEPDKKPQVVVKELATSTVNLEVKFWVETFDYKKGTAQVKSEVMQNVLKALVDSGVGLPADILELKHYKGPGFPVKLIEEEGDS